MFNIFNILNVCSNYTSLLDSLRVIQRHLRLNLQDNRFLSPLVSLQGSRVEDPRDNRVVGRLDNQLDSLLCSLRGLRRISPPPNRLVSQQASRLVLRLLNQRNNRHERLPNNRRINQPVSLRLNLPGTQPLNLVCSQLLSRRDNLFGILRDNQLHSPVGNHLLSHQINRPHRLVKPLVKEVH